MSKTEIVTEAAKKLGITVTEPKSKTLKIHSIDNGFCHVNYSAINGDGKTVYYCLQDEGTRFIGLVICYRCSRDFEPSYPVKHSKDLFEVPTGDSAIEIAVRNYLTKEK